jgi:hypothetical protein
LTPTWWQKGHYCTTSHFPWHNIFSKKIGA